MNKTIPNPNRPRSKNNPDGKRNDPQIDWPTYNQGRRSEGKRYAKWMPMVAYKAREIMCIPQGERDWRVSAILVSVVKSEEGVSQVLVKHFDKHPGDLRRCELPRPYSKSLYQLRVSEIKLKAQQKIIVWMAGNDAVHGTKIVDSSGYSMAKYVDWYHTNTARSARGSSPSCISYTHHMAGYAPRWSRRGRPTTRRS